MRRFFLILRLFLKAKFIFKNPSKNDLVVFDDVSLIDFKNFIYNYNYFLLQNRIENINKIYFSFKIFRYFLKNYKGNIMTAYLISLLEIIKPKVVLTCIDNSFKFFDLAKVLDKKMKFVAVQNAARYDLKEYKYLYEKKIIKSNFAKKFYIPNFLCFGQFEIDHYRFNKIKVKNFIKVGSIRLANFFYQIKKDKKKLKKFNYDICIISEAIPGRDSIFKTKSIEKGYAHTVKFAIKFCIKHKMKFIIPLKRDKTLVPEAHKREINFFKKYLNDAEFNYFMKNSFKRERDRYSSYKAMFNSRVAVGTASTLLRENLAFGGKSLACNFTRTNIYDFPIKGICSIKNCTYEEFEKRLLKICSISKKNYFSKLNKDQCYTAEYNKKFSTIDILKRNIDQLLDVKNKNIKYN